MRVLVWEALLVAAAFALTWFFLLRAEPSAQGAPRAPARDELSVLLTPIFEEAAELVAARDDTAPTSAAVEAPVDQDEALEPRATEPEPPAESMVAAADPEQVPEPLLPEDTSETNEPAPPPPELGSPEGEGEQAVALEAEEAVEPVAAPRKEATGESQDAVADEEVASSESLMRNEELLASADREVLGEARQGFATVLVASPEDQLDIAEFFGEELVLVPRASLDPKSKSPRYFRIAKSGAVEAVQSRPALERFRQYRDLFDYEYSRLPRTLRELRKSVLGRNEIFLFAALIPVREWAVVVGRRREALARSGRPLSDVRRFVLRYERRPDRGFELIVDEIVFADGERFHPQPLVSEIRR